MGWDGSPTALSNDLPLAPVTGNGITLCCSLHALGTHWTPKLKVAVDCFNPQIHVGPQFLLDTSLSH